MADNFKISLQLFAGEKTEEATPHRKQESRKKGQVAKSADLNAAIVVISVVVLIYMLKNFYLREVMQYFTYLFANFLNREALTTLSLFSLTLNTIYFVLKIVGPVFLVALFIGVGINVAQVGFLFSPEAVKFKLEKINPISGFKRMFSMRSIIELVKALMKLILVGVVTYNIVKGNILNIINLVDTDIYGSFNMIVNLIFKVSMNALMVFFVISIFDLVMQRFQFAKSIKMSKQEIKEEFKQMEGDPLIKSKIKEKQRQMSMHRMMQSVPDATVIITNPTHLAVAIKYTMGTKEAPMVLAKGAGAVAAKIKEKGKEAKVPIVEDKPVARFLYANVEIGQEIPEELYQAVAEILAVIYKTGKRM